MNNPYIVDCKARLAVALFAKQPPLCKIGNRIGYIESVQREDGSGNCHNITIRLVGLSLPERETFFHRFSE